MAGLGPRRCLCELDRVSDARISSVVGQFPPRPQT